MRQKLNKIVEDGMRARHERREGILQMYRDLHNYFLQKKAKKLIARKQKELTDNLTIQTTISKDHNYIESLMNGTHITGELLYDWDAKDGDRMNSGGGKFSRIAESALYKNNISDTEIALFKRHAGEISSLILLDQPKRIIDMGGGDGKKTIEILSLLEPAVLANINITTKDISPYLGEEFLNNIQSWSQHAKVPVDSSFIYENFLAKKELQSNKDKRMYLFSGGSIGQFDDESIVSIIQNMISEAILGKRHILMTAFIAPNKESLTYADDIQKLLATYGSPDTDNPHYDGATHKIIEDWVMSGIHYHLGKQVENKLAFHVAYEDQGDIGGRIILGAKVTHPLTITVGNKTYTKEPGDFLPAIQSRRFSKKHIFDLIRKSGCDVDAFDQECGVGQVLFHTPSINLDNITPDRVKSWRNTAKLLGACALLIGGMILGNKLSDYKKEKQQQERRRQDVSRELGNTKNTGYGPTAAGIESGRDAYSRYLKEIYGVKDPDGIKYDFLSRYVQAYKRGEIHYGGRMGGYTDPIVLIDKYIIENKLRIKFDKGIEFIAHKELQDKEHIMYQTLAANGDISYGGISKAIIPENYEYKYAYTMYGGSATEYKSYRMKEGFYIEMEYIFKEIDGKTYMLARPKVKDNKNEMFTIENAKKLIMDYFTPIGASDVSDHLAGLVESDSGFPESMYIQDKIIQFAIQGYKFDYSIFANDQYNMKSHYFLQTFFPELRIKDSLTRSYNLREDIDLVVEELVRFYPSLGMDTKYGPEETTGTTPGVSLARIESKIFNNIVVNTLSPGFYKRENGKKITDRQALKNWINNFITDLEIEPSEDFPFTYLYEENSILGSRGIISESEDNLFSNGGLAFREKGTYTTKEGLEFMRGYIENSSGKHLVATYIGNDKSQFIKKHISVIEQEYFAKNHSGWGEKEKKIIAQGRNINTMIEYDNIILDRKQCIDDANSILQFPNSYFAKIIYEDWLNK